MDISLRKELTKLKKNTRKRYVESVEIDIDEE